ncbi:hypothetical protein E3N88_30285 [Mikania micrantha]|uniref:peptidylprolyl isomerase n=1 Tax=Mikania micrantha TaxID=192012 RepID=A0A5N6MLY2_9ASTR|nr:hypothetical protein E3N88_30285 [Mikania micrantha]
MISLQSYPHPEDIFNPFKSPLPNPNQNLISPFLTKPYSSYYLNHPKMAAIFSCSSLYTTSKSPLFNNPFNPICSPNNSSIRRIRPICSSQNPNRFQFCNKQKDGFTGIKECVLSVALAVGLITGVPSVGNANAVTPALSDLAVLISGPPIKDPEALLRYALPIDNKAIREVQKPLEDITESLKVSGVKALDSVERNLKQASRALKQGKNMIIAGLAESKKDHAIELLGKLEVGMEELQKIAEDRKRDAVAPKQKELLQYVGGVEEDMVDGFPYEVPEEYQNMPLLKGRATVDMKVKVKDNPNLEDCVFRIVLDGYNAPVTAGNFIDLVERHFYDGMEIQRADGFVVQTGDPEGPAEGFIDPSTEKMRTIPLEIMVEGEKTPVYGATLEDIGLYKAQTKLPFNAFGTMAMAREEFENNSASSQVFWLLKESELTPSNANILDGRYAVFGYVTQNEDFLADLKVGDVIESVQVVAGLDNLVNPSYKIAG